MSYFATFIFCLFYALCIKFCTNSESESDNETVYMVAGGYRPAKLQLGKYVVSVRRKNTINYRYNQITGSTHYCGGAILNSKLILTAGHCLKIYHRESYPSELEVITNERKPLVRVRHTEVIDVSDVIVHQHSQEPGIYADVGLLHLKRKIHLDGNNAQVLPLPRSPPVPGAKCISLGWEKTSMEDEEDASKIVYINETILKNSDCRKHFPMLPEGQLCATNPNNPGSDTCEGDTGGPLICNGVITGIASNSFACGVGMPEVFTDVYKYVDWIRKSKSGRPKPYVWMLLSLKWTTMFACRI